MDSLTRLLGPLIAVAFLATSLADAAAASLACERLRDRLASVDRSVSSDDINRYAGAIAQQNLELRKARQDQRRLRCLTSSITTIRADGGSDCGDLAKALSRMESNKQILTGKLVELREGLGAAEAVRLEQALTDNGCNGEGTLASTPDEPQRVPYLDTLPEPYRPDRAGEAAASFRPTIGILPSGDVRTLCVRTCDGGFFPISSRTSAINFARDAAQCQQMCPGVETELFFHSATSGETSDMVSAVTGQSYRDMPNAFVYRTRRPAEDPQCRCDLARYHQRMTPRPAVSDYQSSIVTIKPQQAATKQTSALAPAPERELDASALNVRRVGPVFLPTQSDEIDLRKPAAPGPQPLQE
ncbi:DUF2865 domain-containing protein [Rhizobium sp. AG855]|uniref:DUF2865 domain-containing protein n=1 Tax=Rhizobium sp. AG855 TaxID=2183898 RepID=UPI000E71FF45|nr:DUF2865 domain-containing protein [Rhizobium sp. AG855]RKE84460.1 uncharacterized protein DUF2865 [Rhizobium sp. AG855]